MKKKMVFYTIISMVFMILSYLFIVSGIDMKTKIYVKYQQVDDISYVVNLLPNTVYENDYLNMGGNYIGSLVKDIDLDLKYNLIYARNITGYYVYNLKGTLVASEGEDILWEKNYDLLADKVTVLDQNKVKDIRVKDRTSIDYQKYVNEINDFNKKYNMEVSGILLVSFKLKTTLDFTGFKNTYDDTKEVKMVIPVTNEVFKIKILDDNREFDSYNEMTNKEGVNYLFLVFGALCLSVGIAFLMVVIKNLLEINNKENKYVKELKKILNEHGDEIVNVYEFNNAKKYNLIYVDSFKELLDVYDKVDSPISFKELKKNQKAVFLIIENDNAWIYILKV
ncbi:MAG: DUF5305 family protein [bacterium]|nr:DUF5305 family protein [bacterium]